MTLDKLAGEAVAALARLVRAWLELWESAVAVLVAAVLVTVSPTVAPVVWAAAFAVLAVTHDAVHSVRYPHLARRARAVAIITVWSSTVAVWWRLAPTSRPQMLTTALPPLVVAAVAIGWRRQLGRSKIGGQLVGWADRKRASHVGRAAITGCRSPCPRFSRSIVAGASCENCRAS